MGFFSSIFKGIKKVIKGIGKVIKKVVKSKAFKVVAAVGLAIVAPQLIPTMIKGLSTAGAWAASTIAKGATLAWSGITAAGSALMSGAQAAGSAIMKGAQAAGSAVMKGGSQIFRSVTETISSGIKYMKGKIASGIDYTKDILGFGPKTLEEGMIAQEKQIAKILGRKVGTIVADPNAKIPGPLGQTLKDFGREYIVEPFIETGLKMGKDKLLGTEEEEEERRESLLGPQVTPVERYVDTPQNYGLPSLMNLAANTQSPYLSYQQTQQAFAKPPSLATVGNV